MKRLILITIMMLLSLDVADAQLINKWVSLDTTQAYYHSPIPWRTKNIVSYDRDNLIVIEQVAANAGPFLKYSSDAGETWERLLEGGSFVYNFNSLDYPDKDMMYVVGDSSEFLKSESGWASYKRWGLIFSSFDRGKTWNKTILDSNSQINHIDMLDSYTGIAIKQDISNVYNILETVNDTLLYTNDGFETYELIAVEDAVRIEEINILSETTFIIRVRYFFTQENKYLITNDKGNSWSEYYEDSYNLRTIHFVDLDNAYKIEYRYSEENPQLYSTDLYKTTNSGESWEYLFTPTDDKWSNYSISEIATFGVNHVLLVGRNSLFYRSTDGGNSWQKEYVGNNLSGGIDMEYDILRYPSYAAEDVAYLVAGNYLLKMTDEKILARPYLYYYKDRFKADEATPEWSEVEGALFYRYQLAFSADNFYDYAKFDTLTIDTVVESTSLLLPILERNSSYYGRVKAIGDGIESEWFIRAPHILTSDEFVSVNNNISKVSLAVYPNPTRDILHIRTDELISRIELSDVLGNVVITHTSDVLKTSDEFKSSDVLKTSDVLSINVENLPAGMYFLKLYTMSGEVLVEIVIVGF